MVIDFSGGALVLGAGAIAGASAVAAVAVDYSYPPSFNYEGLAIMLGAVGVLIASIGTFIAQMVGLSRQKVTHDLVNSLSVEARHEAKDAAKVSQEAAFAEGKLAGGLEERAARNTTAQMPQVPIPKQ